MVKIGMMFRSIRARSKMVLLLTLVIILISAYGVTYTYSQRYYVVTDTSTKGLGSSSSLSCIRLGFIARNIILLIGDGMGYSHIYATHLVYRALNITTQFNTIGIAFTNVQDNIVLDSAGAGTALATGFKTLNSMISMIEVDSREIPVMTVLELAKSWACL